MNTNRNNSYSRIGLSLALISLLCFAAGCRPVLPNVLGMDAGDSGQYSRSAGYDVQIGDGGESDNGEGSIGTGTSESPYAPGSRSGQGSRKVPKKPKKH